VFPEPASELRTGTPVDGDPPNQYIRRSPARWHPARTIAQATPGPADMSYRMGIDIGGTFTDFALFDDDGASLAIGKRLTTPDDPSRAVLQGIAALLQRESVSIAEVSEIVHGTTLVTNAIIERRGAVTGLLTTAGFIDVLDMGQEKRYDVFDLRITFPPPIVPRALRREVRERVHYDGRVETALDLDHALRQAAELVEDGGVQALAICLLHAYANPAHEHALRDAVRARWPELFVSTSSDVFPGRREFERFTTTTVNAFAGPLFGRYLQRLEQGLEELGFGGRFFVMSSAGGTLAPATARSLPVRVVESGPAAGAQMSAFHGEALGLSQLLSFDMGGTTAKGALIRDTAAMKVYDLEVARQHEFKAGSGLPLKTPVIDMIEIGAGGGSIAEIDARGTIRVGPRSAGADPGPACYGRGGTAPTLTDANLVLGYLDAGFFLGGEMHLDVEAARRAIHEHIARPLGLDTTRAAFGIHEIVSEDVARAFRVHASERGFDYRASSMVAFGGSGPVQAMGVARKLRIPRVVFPVAAGVMSALGLLASPLSFEVARTRQVFLERLGADEFAATFGQLEHDAMAPLREAGVAPSNIQLTRRLDMRYHGQGHEIEVTLPASADAAPLFAGLPDDFRLRYETLYAFAFLDAPVVITNWKVEARAPATGLSAGYGLADGGDRGTDARKGRRSAWSQLDGDFVDTPVYDRYALRPGDRVPGPALVEERESTLVIARGDSLQVDAFFNLVAELDAEGDAG
jgi:N-methylhydantoinase A